MKYVATLLKAGDTDFKRSIDACGGMPHHAF
jgi:hypothetical protein